MTALSTLDEIIADMGGDTPGTVGHRLALVREDVAGVIVDARLLAFALAGAYAAMEMEPPPAVAPLLERHLGVKGAALARVGGAA